MYQSEKHGHFSKIKALRAAFLLYVIVLPGAQMAHLAAREARPENSRCRINVTCARERNNAAMPATRVLRSRLAAHLAAAKMASYRRKYRGVRLLHRGY